MFDIGALELLVIAVVMILVVRPKDLPTMLRTIGQYISKLRGMAREFQNQFEEAARDSGIDNIRKGISSVKDMSPANKVKEALNSIGDDLNGVSADIANSVDAAGSPDRQADNADKPAAKPAKKKAAATKSPAAKKRAAAKKPVAAKKPAAASKASTGS